MVDKQHATLAQLHLSVSNALKGATGACYFFIVHTRRYGWEVAWPELVKIAELYAWPVCHKEWRVRLPNGAFIQVIEAENKRTLGLAFNNIVFDELPEHEDWLALFRSSHG